MAAPTVLSPMTTGTAAQPSVLVLKEREIVRRTPNALVTSSVAITTAISMARLRTAAAPMLPVALQPAPVMWGMEAALLMKTAEET